MHRRRGSRVGPLGWAPRLLSLALAGLLLAACTGARGGSSAGGNARVTPVDEQSGSGAPAPSSSGGAPASSSGRPRPSGAESSSSADPMSGAGGALSSSDLGAVYRTIVEGYIDPVEPATLLRAADATLRESSTRAGALPLDTAPIDLAPAAQGDPDRNWQGFARAYDIMIQKHPHWAGEARPDRAVIRAMLATLGDGHSQYMEAEEVRRMSETGFTGIGIRMSKPAENEAPVIVEVFQGSPAARAGLRPGDRVAAVDGQPSQARGLTEVVALIRGQQGSPVVLSISRGGAPGVDTRIMRGPVQTPPVEGSIRAGTIGVLRIRSFGEGVPEAVTQVLTQGRNRGAQAWIVDLRGNTGGSIEAMRRVAANFVDARPVGLSIDRAGAREPISTVGRPAIPPTPVVVLIDKETASGAEVLAAAMQEYGIATLVGMKTGGNVGIAAPRPLSDGSAVQVTVARLLSPAGAQIDAVGVKPDTEVDLTITDLERGEDPQLVRAAEVLLGSAAASVLR